MPTPSGDISGGRAGRSQASSCAWLMDLPCILYKRSLFLHIYTELLNSEEWPVCAPTNITKRLQTHEEGNDREHAVNTTKDPLYNVTQRSS